VVAGVTSGGEEGMAEESGKRAALLMRLTCR
jgi:hypothetical protein